MIKFNKNPTSNNKIKKNKTKINPNQERGLTEARTSDLIFIFLIVVCPFFFEKKM